MKISQTYFLVTCIVSLGLMLPQMACETITIDEEPIGESEQDLSVTSPQVEASELALPDGADQLALAEELEEMPTEFESMEALLEFFGETVHFYNENEDTRAHWVVGPYPPCSGQHPYKIVNHEGRRTQVKIRSAKVVNFGWGDVQNTRFIINVADGQCKSLSYTFSICRTIGMSYADKYTLGDYVNTTITNSSSWQVCEKYSQGQTWCFPSHCQTGEYNSASFYGGMWADRIEFVVEYVPWERDEPGYRDCIEMCDDIGPEIPERGGDTRAPNPCIRFCQMEFPYERKCNEMTTETGIMILPRPVEWSVCHPV